MTRLLQDTDDDAAARGWLRAAAAGDRAAFSRLYRQLHPRLRRFLARLCPRADLVDDAINDAMMVAWRKAAEFRGDSRVSTWVTGIAYRCLLRALRDGTASAELGESVLGDEGLARLPGDTDTAGEHERRDWLERGLRTLPEEQRTTVLLVYVMGETCEDIARIMGCAVGTVKARLFHARVRLRHVLPALAGEAPREANGDGR